MGVCDRRCGSEEWLSGCNRCGGAEIIDGVCEACSGSGKVRVRGIEKTCPICQKTNMEPLDIRASYKDFPEKAGQSGHAVPVHTEGVLTGWRWVPGDPALDLHAYPNIDALLSGNYHRETQRVQDVNRLYSENKALKEENARLRKLAKEANHDAD